ncbi:MAG: DUF6884 domain-containing protein [Patescibacteria group bacterium]
MKKIVLIACASKKANRAAPAEDFYISPLFRANLAYAHSLRPDAIFILSAKYGLVELDRRLVPYNLTLKTMSDQQVRVWAERVLKHLRAKADIDNLEVVVLAGEKYRRHLVSSLRYSIVPLKNLGIGKQLHWLKVNLNNESVREPAQVGK